MGLPTSIEITIRCWLGMFAAVCPGQLRTFLSEIWLDVARGLPRLKDISSVGFQKLLFTIASRRIIDLRRRRAAEPVAELPDATDTQPTPSDVAEANEGYQTALNAVARLPENQQEIVLLRIVAGA